MPVKAPAKTPEEIEQERIARERTQQRVFGDARVRHHQSLLDAGGSVQSVDEAVRKLTTGPSQSIKMPGTLGEDIIRFANAGAGLVLDPVGRTIGSNPLSRVNPGYYVANAYDELVDNLVRGGSGMQGGPILPGTSLGADGQGIPPATAGRQISNTLADAANGVGDFLRRPAIGSVPLPQLPPTTGGTGGALSPDAAGALDAARRQSQALSQGKAPLVTPPSIGSAGTNDIMARVARFLDAPQGPSVAAEQLKLAQAENSANLLGLARSAGTSGDRLSAINNALVQGGAQSQLASGQAAALIAQEEQARRAQALQGLGLGGELALGRERSGIEQRGQDIGLATANANRALESQRLGLEAQQLGQSLARDISETGMERERLNLAREAENRMRAQGARTLGDQLLDPLGQMLALWAMRG